MTCCGCRTNKDVKIYLVEGTITLHVCGKCKHRYLVGFKYVELQRFEKSKIVVLREAA